MIRQQIIHLHINHHIYNPLSSSSLLHISKINNNDNGKEGEVGGSGRKIIHPSIRHHQIHHHHRDSYHLDVQQGQHEEFLVMN